MLENTDILCGERVTLITISCLIHGNLFLMKFHANGRKCIIVIYKENLVTSILYMKRIFIIVSVQAFLIITKGQVQKCFYHASCLGSPDDYISLSSFCITYLHMKHNMPLYQADILPHHARITYFPSCFSYLTYSFNPTPTCRCFVFPTPHAVNMFSVDVR